MIIDTHMIDENSSWNSSLSISMLSSVRRSEECSIIPVCGKSQLVRISKKKLIQNDLIFF